MQNLLQASQSSFEQSEERINELEKSKLISDVRYRKKNDEGKQTEPKRPWNIQVYHHLHNWISKRRKERKNI